MKGKIMRNQLYDLYGSRYEYLIYDLFSFFMDNSIKSKYESILVSHGISNALHHKCVEDFILKFEKEYRSINDDPIQPKEANQICEKLCRNNSLSKVDFAIFNNIDGMNSFYIAFDNGFSKCDKRFISKRLNSIVYEFQYIYESNKNIVLPILVRKKEEENPHIGTCFKSLYGFITAKHCVERFDNVWIENVLIPKKNIHLHPDVDLALIIPEDYDKTGALIDGKGNVLDNVMSLGYPKISGFSNFLNGTVGNITAIEQPYLSKGRLILLTCPVRGGNSGGPIVNEFGEVVGVITDLPFVESDCIEYDNFGYGCATPIEYIFDI